MTDITIADSWFDALGKPVNDANYRAALDFAVSLGHHPVGGAMCLDVICREIRHDNPDRAVKYARSWLGRDETAVIRLLATLTAPIHEAVRDSVVQLRRELG
jgi:hypothetical protein